MNRKNLIFLIIVGAILAGGIQHWYARRPTPPASPEKSTLAPVATVPTPRPPLPIPVPAPLHPPVILSAKEWIGTDSIEASYVISAGNNPTSYSASPLPPGLEVDAKRGLIHGKPTAIGKWTVVVSATNGAGVGSMSVTFTVKNPHTKPLFNPGQIDGDGSLSYLVLDYKEDPVVGYGLRFDAPNHDHHFAAHAGDPAVSTITIPSDNKGIVKVFLKP